MNASVNRSTFTSAGRCFSRLGHLLLIVFAHVLQLGSLTQDALAAPQLLQPIDSGWYRQEEDIIFHQPDNTNYIVGHSHTSRDSEYRNFFVFDLSSVHGSIVSATFSSDLTDYGASVSTNGIGTWTLYDVITPISALRSAATPQATFDDLAAGTIYGTLHYTRNDNGGTVSVSLNAAAIAAMNSSGGLWAFGGAVTDLQGPYHYDLLYNGGNLDTFPRMVVNVPEPSTWMLVGLAVAIQFRGRKTCRKI